MAKILIIDDDANCREMLRGRLKKNHHDILDAGDGEEGLLTTQRLHPDLIILDLNLPRKDGYSLLGELKTSPQLKYIPIVVFTTANTPQDITLTYSLQANCFINKPLCLDHFLSVIEAINHFWLKTVELPTEDQPRFFEPYRVGLKSTGVSG